MKILENKVVLNTGILFSVTVFGSLFAFLANIYLSNLLGPENFGVFKTIVYIATFIPVFVGFGMQSTIPRYIAKFLVENKNKISHLIKWFIKVRLVSYLTIISGLYLFREQFAIRFLHDGSLSYLIYPLIAIILSSYPNIVQLIAQGYQKFKLVSLIQFLSTALPITTAILLTQFGTVVMLYGWAFGFLVTYLIAIPPLLRLNVFNDKHSFDLRDILVKYSLPMYALNLTLAVSSLAVPVFSLFFPQKLIGYYSYSMIFYTAALLLPNSIAFIILPKISELTSKKLHNLSKRIITETLTIYTPVVIVGILGTIFIGKMFISIISPQYLPSLPIFTVLISLGLISGYFTILSYYFQGNDNIKMSIATIVAQNILLFLISYILLSIYKV